jgi:RHS repeat-associated protein
MLAHTCLISAASRRSPSTGKERDSESGNDYFGARYYASSMGRFMTPDPMGMTYADRTNPQSLNLYSYVLNNPPTKIDPTGLDCVQAASSSRRLEQIPPTSAAPGLKGEPRAPSQKEISFSFPKTRRTGSARSMACSSCSRCTCRAPDGFGICHPAPRREVSAGGLTWSPPVPRSIVRTGHRRCSRKSGWSKE